MTVILELKVRGIDNPWKDLRVSSGLGAQSRLPPDKGFLFVLDTFRSGIVLEDFAPQILFPLVEVIFCREGLGVAAGHVMQTNSAKLLKVFIKFDAHLIVLFV